MFTREREFEREIGFPPPPYTHTSMHTRGKEEGDEKRVRRGRRGVPLLVMEFFAVVRERERARERAPLSYLFLFNILFIFSLVKKSFLIDFNFYKFS